MRFKLEICVDSVESAIAAQIGGADRIELCDNLIEGGTTPGYGTIVSAKNNLDISLFVLIRPRGGDFLYTDLEYDIMRRDIDICGECGVDGIVLGILRADGGIDVERTEKLVELANPMPVTFHRAFDMCSDPFRGLTDVISTGSARLLTSGQNNSAEKGSALISQLISQSGKKLIIMPGSGINPLNILSIAKITGADEFHLSARKTTESEMIFRREGICLGGISGISEFSRKVADPETIRSVVKILSDI
jgi:copper homeostasis protein